TQTESTNTSLEGALALTQCECQSTHPTLHECATFRRMRPPNAARSRQSGAIGWVGGGGGWGRVGWVAWRGGAWGTRGAAESGGAAAARLPPALRGHPRRRRDRARAARGGTPSGRGRDRADSGSVATQGGGQVRRVRGTDAVHGGR